MSDNSSESGGKSLGVRFAESTVGEPIITLLLFITSSFWISFATVGLLIFISSLFMGDTVIAGIIALFGLSGIFVGVLGYVSYLVYVRARD